MNIIETNFKFKQKLSNRSQTNYIILHHRAGNGDTMSIHNLHLNRGFSGIGYHYYIRKDGSIYTDVDYFELLGRKALEMEKNNPNPKLPVNYGEGVDVECVKLAKEVVKGLDAGMSHDELNQYLNTCIKYDE